MSQKKALHKWEAIFNGGEMRPKKSDLDQNLYSSKPWVAQISQNSN